MAKGDFAEAFNRKGANIDGITKRVITDPQHIPELTEGLRPPKGALRYGYEKGLRQVAERQLKNTRAPVAKKAARFLQAHAPQEHRCVF